MEFMKYTKEHPERQSHYDNASFKKQTPAIQYVNFEYCNFPMEIDDDIDNSIGEFDKDNGKNKSIHAYGIHKDIKIIEKMRLPLV